MLLQELNDQQAKNVESYQHPAFKIDSTQLEELLAECQRVTEALAARDFVPGSLVSLTPCDLKICMQSGAQKSDIPNCSIGN